MHKLIQNFVIVKRKFKFVVFSFSQDCYHCRCSKKSTTSSYNTFGSQANLYDGQLFVQSHVFIAKLAYVDNLIRL